MHMVSGEEALNIIAFIFYIGFPILIALLIWIGISLKKIKKELKRKNDQ